MTLHGHGDYFDEASKEEAHKSGVSRVLFIKDTYSYRSKERLRKGINKYVELMALKLIMILAAKKGVSKIQISKDTLLVIDWMKVFISWRIWF